jgi:hypothetical protein
MEEAAAMCGKMTILTLAVIPVLGFLGTAPAVAGKDDIDTRAERGGSVVACSLDGVNPAHHPEIFGNPTVASAYGFVRSRDGTWQVRPNCRR